MATAEFSTATKERRYEFPLSVVFAIFFAGASVAFARGLWLPWIHTNPQTMPMIGVVLALVIGLFGVSAFFSIRLAFEIIERTCGKRPVGWYTGRVSRNTSGLLREVGGLLYNSDAYNDDLPYWLPGFLRLLLAEART